MKPEDILSAAADRLGRQFHEERRILSFSDYLALFAGNPVALSRSAPQYVSDMFDAFGTDDAPEGASLPGRNRLFDQAFAGGGCRVHGQEVVQDRVRRLLRAAADAGRTEKMILLHGPNGSGKSVFVEALFRALEEYSRRPEGALYRFNWVFPRGTVPGTGLGFGRSDEGGVDGESFAGLRGEEIAARLTCELKDHPLLVLPREEREILLVEALRGRSGPGLRSCDWLLRAELCQKCRAICEGLLAGAQGDWRQVIRHVQVERYRFSQRYRQGAVTIHPVGSVDAQEQQIAADFSAQSLPPVLQNLKMFEAFGDLVASNGGIVEFGDFLKRPHDLNKYLLTAVEKGCVSLPNTTVYLNVVITGTTNDRHLDAFKTTPDFGSFKGRIELVPVPYILEVRKEAALYRDMMAESTRGVHVAPHAFESAALWAVLTRLLPPEAEGLPEPLSGIAVSLTPLEKAVLYDRAEAPERLDRSQRRELLAGLPALRRQHEDQLIYEGRFGASPREMRMVLTQAAYDAADGCLTPPRVFRRIEDLLRDRSLYEFLNIEPERGYHDAAAFLRSVTEDYARRLLGEIQDAMELAAEAEYDRRFDEYFVHAVAAVRREKVRNPQTGEAEPPSDKLLKGVEALFGFRGSAEDFRRDLVARVGAHAVDHPHERPNFRALFPDLLRAVKRDYYARRRGLVETLLQALPIHGSPEAPPLPPETKTIVRRTLGNLVGRHGYCERCARGAADWLRRRGLAGETDVTPG